MTRRLLTLLLWLSVACALLLAASGCGGRSAAEGSYSNSDYGFSLAYGSPLKAMTSAISPATLGVDFAYGFVDPKAGGLKDGTLTGVVVSVKGSDNKQVSAHLAAVARAAWWTQASQKAAELGSFKLLSKKEFMLNGAPARLYEGEGTNAGHRCVFRSKPNTDSTASRTLIPEQAEHRFRRQAEHFSGPGAESVTFRQSGAWRRPPDSPRTRRGGRGGLQETVHAKDQGDPAPQV